MSLNNSNFCHGQIAAEQDGTLNLHQAVTPGYVVI